MGEDKSLGQVQELNVYLIPRHEDKILLLKRSNDIWEFPGGGVEWGEDPEKAARRELKEETDLEVKELKLLCVTSATFKKDNIPGQLKHAVYIVYNGEVTHAKYHLSGEHTEARWLLLREVKFLKLGLNAEPVLEFLAEK
jgi:ADP-ribose pyrophosphatase YjhB (NUDIX family)